MPANYVLLEKITVGSASVSSVTFSGIPQTGYTDLVVKASSRTASASVFGTVKFFPNSVTPTAVRILEAGGAVVSSTNLNAEGAGGNATANTFGNITYYLFNYTSSAFKSASIDFSGENNGAESYIGSAAHLISTTSPITSILIEPNPGSTFVQHSTFYLYGVAKLDTTPAIAPKATGGDIIDTDGTYWYHTFLSSGTFTPATALTCDYLVVAGGGGGSGSTNRQEGVGGGGAGGLRSTVTATGGGGSLESKLSLGTSAYTVTVGAGGAGGSAGGLGSAGSDSVFATITSTGGGRGGKEATAGGTGGSGGGAEYGTAGAGTTNQGYAGATAGGSQRSGGGGGAGAVGSAGNVTAAGGAGVAVSISGSSVTYAGGGGGGGSYTSGALPTGGAGGSGGGGAGGNGNYGAGTAGTVNTGGGGGAGAGGGVGNSSGAAGGSGIVIVRYAV
jgi:hypothetical protein